MWSRVSLDLRVLWWWFCLAAANQPDYQHRWAGQVVSSDGLCRYGNSVECCWGWRQTVWGHCQPYCQQGCKHGVCVGPDKCRCHPGYTGKTCNQDLNECGVRPRPCKHRCMNTLGSYKCYCLDGHTLQHDGTCKNAHTCSHANCQYGCEVIKGAVRCTCPSPGLRLGPDRRTCVDTDECVLGLGVCPRRRKCVNTFGSFLCKCHHGFKLTYLNGRYACIDKDTRPFCSLNPESPKCRCKDGGCKALPKVTLEPHRPRTTTPAPRKTTAPNISPTSMQTTRKITTTATAAQPITTQRPAATTTTVPTTTATSPTITSPTITTTSPTTTSPTITTTSPTTTSPTITSTTITSPTITSTTITTTSPTITTTSPTITSTTITTTSPTITTTSPTTTSPTITSTTITTTSPTTTSPTITSTTITTTSPTTTSPTITTTSPTTTSPTITTTSPTTTSPTITSTTITTTSPTTTSPTITTTSPTTTSPTITTTSPTTTSLTTTSTTSTLTIPLPTTTMEPTTATVAMTTVLATMSSSTSLATSRAPPPHSTTLDNSINQEVTHRQRGDVHIPRHPGQNQVWEFDIELGNTAEDSRDDPVAGVLHCSFEHGVCGWMSDREGDLPWQTVHNRAGGQYLSVPELKAGQWSIRGARLTVPLVPPWNHGDLCFSFSHWLTGHHVGVLQVFVKKGRSQRYGPALWSRTGRHGWRQTQIILERDTEKVLLKAERRRGQRGEIAIDDITLKRGPCQ